ncbi:unnamed protein product [Rangifer tarandus platyrhynchus]|uniref:Uncharacterized protein n=1 Tax=Rangifer tarandus platyrhynchus TaxID=3082113 RepID=A0ABN8ZQI8_RANTA|nr:unnamed protein product [Rangifer tarandus platyrhynchus]
MGGPGLGRPNRGEARCPSCGAVIPEKRRGGRTPEEAERKLHGAAGQALNLSKPACVRAPRGPRPGPGRGWGARPLLKRSPSPRRARPGSSSYLSVRRRGAACGPSSGTKEAPKTHVSRKVVVQSGSKPWCERRCA